MGYNAFTGRKRPTADATADPAGALSEKRDSALIATIIAFAQNDAHEAWVGLGLDSVPIPKVVLRKLAGNSTLLIDQDTGKPEFIVLNSQYKKKWTEIEYAQVLIMEMGNAKNHDAHQAVRDQVTSMKKLDYVMAIEKIEWDFLAEL